MAVSRKKGAKRPLLQKNYRGPTMKRKTLIAGRSLIILVLIAFTTLAIVNLRDSQHTIKLQKVELQDRTKQLQKLKIEYDQTNTDLQTEIDRKDHDQKKIKELETQKKQLEQEKVRLESELQAKAQRQEAARLAAAKAQSVVVGVAYASGDVNCQTGTGDPKSFIYMCESGNIPCKINGGAVDCNYNGNRACGIGQALPCQKLTAVCKLDNYACQDNWFTSYMLARYGSWANAKAFWIAHRWW